MDGIFQTRDSGKTWQEINTGLTGSRYIAEFAARGDSLYAGTDGDGIFVLNLKNPISWKSFNDGLFQYGTTSIINSGNTLIAGAGQYVFVRPQGAAEWVYTAVDSVTSPIPIKLFLKDSVIYLGTNHGVFKGRADATGWQKADITQFPNRNIVAFTSSGSRVFAGLIYLSDHWIFSTDNNGASWNIHAHEFAIVLNLLASHERLWACRTDGLWWFDLSASTGAGKPGNNSPYDFALHQNYPNPFNPVTTIGFSLPHSALVSLKVYDILGRHVATLAEKQMPSGIHNIKFDGSSLASGVYLYRLTAGEFVQTRKLILLK
jgi:hypothetical protein